VRIGHKRKQDWVALLPPHTPIWIALLAQPINRTPNFVEGNSDSCQETEDGKQLDACDLIGKRKSPVKSQVGMDGTAIYALGFTFGPQS